MRKLVLVAFTLISMSTSGMRQTIHDDHASSAKTVGVVTVNVQDSDCVVVPYCHGCCN